MIVLALLITVFLNTQAWAGGSDLSVFAYDQRIGNQVPLATTFTDQDGRTVSLRQAIGQRPAILALGYFKCPNLCGLVRNDLMQALSRLEPNQDDSLIVLSIDPAETSADAHAAFLADAVRFDGPNRHYLTGSTTAIQAVTEAIGFHSRFDNETKQFLHPAGIVFLARTGIVSSYLLGVGYQPSDVGLGITRAANGVTARALPILLLCFHYDPTTGRYTLAVMRVLQLGAAVTILAVGGTIFLALRRERRAP